MSKKAVQVFVKNANGEFLVVTKGVPSWSQDLATRTDFKKENAAQSFLKAQNLTGEIIKEGAEEGKAPEGNEQKNNQDSQNQGGDTSGDKPETKSNEEDKKEEDKSKGESTATLKEPEHKGFPQPKPGHMFITTDSGKDKEISIEDYKKNRF